MRTQSRAFEDGFHNAWGHAHLELPTVMAVPEPLTCVLVVIGVCCARRPSEAQAPTGIGSRALKTYPGASSSSDKPAGTLARFDTHEPFDPRWGSISLR